MGWGIQFFRDPQKLTIQGFVSMSGPNPLGFVCFQEVFTCQHCGKQLRSLAGMKYHLMADHNSLVRKRRHAVDTAKAHKGTQKPGLGLPTVD